jgi:hypothetical protein
MQGLADAPEGASTATGPDGARCGIVAHSMGKGTRARGRLIIFTTGSKHDE